MSTDTASNLITRESPAPAENKIATIEQTPAALLALAIQKDLDMDKLERLMQMQEKWEARQAEIAFYEAYAKFQAKVPEIKKSKKVDFPSSKGGRVSYYYAPLSEITKQIQEPLSANDLSYRWDIQEEQKLITVTCYLSHKLGHTKQNSMSAMPDESGNKNVIQQKGSTIQYLQRYTLIGVTGLSTADSDIDGRGPANTGPKTIDENQLANLQSLIEEVGADSENFLKFLKVESLESLPAAKYARAVKALEEKRTVS